MTTRKVRIVQGLAGYNYSYQAGEVVELPTELADKWVRKLLAEEIDEKAPKQEQKADISAQVEQTTSTEQPETASLTTKRKKPGRPRKKTE